MIHIDLLQAAAESGKAALREKDGHLQPWHQDKMEQPDLAPIALLEQLPEPKRPNCVLAPCTPKAKEVTWPKPKEVPKDREHGRTLQVMRWLDGE